MKKGVWAKVVEKQADMPRFLLIKQKSLFAYILHIGIVRFASLLMIPYVLFNPEFWQGPLRDATQSSYYLAHYRYLCSLLILTVAGVLLEVLVSSLILNKAKDLDRGKHERELRLWILLRNLPLPLLMLTLVAEPLWVPIYVFLGLNLLLLDLLFSRPGSPSLFHLRFEAYQTLSFKRGLVWLTTLSLWSGYIFGFLTPSFFPTGSTSKSTIKANMHAFQPLIETYAVDWQGVYPTSLNALEQDAQDSDPRYWKDILNHCQQQTGRHSSYSQFDRRDQQQLDYQATYFEILGIRFQTKSDESGELRPEAAGQIIYQPLSPQGYRILGRDCKGRWIHDGDRILSLSNS